MKLLPKNTFTPHDGTTFIERLKGAKSGVNFRISVSTAAILKDE